MTERAATLTHMDRLATWLVALGLAVALGWLQLETPGLVTGDGYFHARATQQLAEHGVRKQFPQTVFSTWADRYSDKDFLFHVLLIPFAGEESRMVEGAKVAAWLFGSAIMLTLAALLIRWRVRFGWLWLLLLGAAQPWWWLHLIQARPHLLGIWLLLVEVGALLAGRRWLLAGAAGAHVLSHTSFLLLAALPLARAVGLALRGRPAAPGDFVAVGAGVLLVTFLHPYFPNNLSLTWDQAVELARNLWSGSPAIPKDLFGAELGSLRPRSLLRTGVLWIPAVLALVLRLRNWRQRPPSVEVLTLAALSVGMLGVSLLSMRFMAFFLPLCALTGALALSEWLGGLQWALASPGRFGRRHVVWVGTGGLVVALCLGGIADNVSRVVERIDGTRSVGEAGRAVAFLDRVAAPEDIVFHAFWLPFPTLYFHRPDGRYIQALDPIFLYRRDPRRFQQMLEVYRGISPDPHAVIAGAFRARFVYVPRTKPFQSMLRPLMDDPRIRLVYMDRHAMVFEAEGVEGSGS
ncbi:hypothetical protein MK489_13265 [Myxococcota bacterium]|nr:hypothetical protein [Myxococcota bacterium]